MGRSTPVEAGLGAPAGPCQTAETAKVALVCYPAAGLLIVASRRPRTGAVVLDVADLSDAAWAVLRGFVAVAGGDG